MIPCRGNLLSMDVNTSNTSVQHGAFSGVGDEEGSDEASESGVRGFLTFRERPMVTSLL